MRDSSRKQELSVFGNKTKQEMFRERASSKEEDREGLGSRDSEAAVSVRSESTTPCVCHESKKGDSQ